MGTLYLVLVLLILAQGVWWVVFFSGTSRSTTREVDRRLEAERALAQRLLDSGELSASAAGTRFPDLVVEEASGPPSVRVAADARARIRNQGRRRRTMLVSEGAFFVFLLAMGSLILLVAQRRERDYRRAHELFLAGVTHEFRTPLASVLLSAETLERPGLDEPTRREVRRRLLADVDRLQALVGHVLAVTRQGAVGRGTPEAVDLGATARAVADEVRPLVEERGGRLVLDVHEGHHVLGHEALLAVAIRNLLVNAIQHGWREPGSPIVSVTLTGDGRRHRLAVHDEGPGIPKHEQERVFRSFYRIVGRRPSPGAGLGLYLARRNVEGMGGRIELESRDGAGSTFTVVLPTLGVA